MSSLATLPVFVAPALAQTDGATAEDKPGCTPPKRLPVETVAYPEELRLLGNTGDIDFMMKIDATGKIETLAVTRSMHPAIERTVIPYVLGWRFEPGVCDGVPTSAVARQKIALALNGVGTDLNPFAIKARDLDKLPPELRFDEPPSIKVAVAPVYPIDILRDERVGWATVTALINPAGRVQESLIIDADHPQLGLAARAMMQSWTFEPAKKDGKPSWALISRREYFGADSREAMVRPELRKLVEELDEDENYALPVAQLDAPPQPLYRPAPLYPPLLNEGGIGDNVTVDYIIDKKGAVQLPTPVKYQNEELAWMAATTVGRWFFTPPLKKGRPVNARGQTTIGFKPKPTPATAASTTERSSP